MEIKVRVRAEVLLDKLNLETLNPEEIHIEEVRREGEHPIIVITLEDCDP